MGIRAIREISEGLRALVSALAITSAAVFTAACSDPLEVRWFELPPPSTSLDPAALRPGVIWYICDEWGWPPPVTPTVVVDAVFPNNGEGGPSDDQIRAVARLGGEIGYAFNFPALRIRIAPSKAAALYEATYAVLYTVPDLTRYDFRIHVIFRRDLSVADDSLIASFGGAVIHREPSVRSISAYLPDRSLPLLEQHPDVEHASEGGVFCGW